MDTKNLTTPLSSVINKEKTALKNVKSIEKFSTNTAKS